ncbi:hypothetical protein [Desulfomonile tiedjei]|uniref:Uncharacterized protein n=1 Tax=Desulfomonile tiedjei (strain ATCC 49306 / DSM 6799 / DCB-1) TaxID=706587 RepID=I4C7S2_DESTA|nr:hypothetical protein [Desulfomonile tiedjei]AFM25613.1 hypothetical protein Desti_2944 [Desulfomonile tiedjei DSM 6799]
MEARSRFLLALLVTWLVCSPATLKANPAPIPMAGGSVAAQSPHKTVRMDAEDVTIRLGRGAYTVNAVYRMVNTGDATSEWVGFPRGLERERWKGTEFPEFIQFHVWIDGKKIRFTKEGKQWLAARVTFPGNATTIIRVMYEAHYSDRYLWKGVRYLDYIVGTGSLWKDSIAKAVFTVDASETGGTKGLYIELNAPQCRKLSSEQVVRFDVEDFKPDPYATLRIEFGNRRKVIMR